MRKYLAVAGAVFALAPVVFFNSALAADRKHVKKPVDFNQMKPMLGGTTSSLGKTGVVASIKSAVIAKDGTITVRATIVDSDGTPLDRLGVATPGPVSMSFIAAYIPNNQNQYVSYTTTTLPPRCQATPIRPRYRQPTTPAAPSPRMPSETTTIPSKPRRP